MALPRKLRKRKPSVCCFSQHGLESLEVDEKVTVFWDNDGLWYSGTISNIDKERKMMDIDYEDGSNETKVDFDRVRKVLEEGNEENSRGGENVGRGNDKKSRGRGGGSKRGRKGGGKNDKPKAKCQRAKEAGGEKWTGKRAEVGSKLGVDKNGDDVCVLDKVMGELGEVVVVCVGGARSVCNSHYTPHT